ncbi:MAG: hypothetical protein JWN57_563, partial [Frankiales bacterium]|nr:hypothetical protein [Frankiales bacterium]
MSEQRPEATGGPGDVTAQLPVPDADRERTQAMPA